MSYPCVKLDLWIYAAWLLCTLAEPYVNFCPLVSGTCIPGLFSLLHPVPAQNQVPRKQPFPLQLLIWKDDLASPESDGES